MKLVIHAYYTDGYTYGNDVYFPIEYSSKDELQFFLLEAASKNRKDLEQKHDFKSEFSNNIEYITFKPFDTIPDFEITIGDAEDAEHNVMTMEEWFEKEKLN